MAIDIYGTVLKGGTATCMARVIGEDGQHISRTTISAVAYSIFTLDEHDPDGRTVVDGHDGVELVVADVVYNSLQTDSRWTADETGYNFAHTMDVSEDIAFAVAGRNYLVEYILAPASGQIIVVRFRLHCI